MTPTRWYSSLRMQILFLLTVALVPVGAVAIYQTNRVAAAAERNAALALLAVTGRSAKAEELIIERAFGAARFFATVAEDFIENPDRCVRDLGSFVEANPRYSFVGILPVSGQMTCTSSGETFDFSDWEGLAQSIKEKKRSIDVNLSAPMSGESVFVISQPFELKGEFAGFISISVPHAGLPDTPDRLTDLGLEELMTFDTDGTVLTARTNILTAEAQLPQGRNLADIKTGRADAFQDRNAMGQKRIYTVVPIEGSPATVIGVWRAADGLASTPAAVVQPWVFPILMWVASIGVALLSIHMLVLRHIGRLRRAMRAFTSSRKISEDTTKHAMPIELRELRDNFDQLTRDILQDEATLENAVREKGVLVKEIHHRVKNNLQLISSIMNMQIRKAESEETKKVISNLQARVRGLATIHHDLYQSQNEGMVNVATLLNDIIEKSVEIAEYADGTVRLEKEIETIYLYPDQAVPLSLLAAEAMTNSMKYLGANDDDTPWIKAALSQDGTEGTLVLANSIGAQRVMESTGLGSELIEAFAIQLGGKITVEEGADSYVMRVDFRIEEFTPEARDY